PEGISTSPTSPYFFTTGSTNSTIFLGSLTAPTLTPFIPSHTIPGLTISYGQKLTRNNHLILAGGESGRVFIIDTVSKTLLQRYDNGLSETLLNDVAVDEGTGDVYVTDTKARCVWRLRGEDIGEGKPVEGGLERWVDIAGGLVSGINGIVVVPGGYMIVGDMLGGCLWSVKIATREVMKVDTGLLSFIGFPDGLLYSAPYLYAVNGVHPLDLSLTDVITVLELLPPYKTGKVVGRITNPLLDQPSTIAFVPGTEEKELLVVNYQVCFDSRAADGEREGWVQSRLTGNLVA
ncbi:NHL repeat-containing protein, partial [Ascodesmis nigricans]